MTIKRWQVAVAVAAVLLVVLSAGIVGRLSAGSAGLFPAATPVPTPRPTSTIPVPTPTPVTALSGASVIAGAWCDVGTFSTSGCTANTERFNADGPFAVAWVCSVAGVGAGSVETIQILIYDANGRQVDGLSEPCPDPTGTGRGVVPENLPAGAYSMTVSQPTGGPSWEVMLIEAGVTV